MLMNRKAAIAAAIILGTTTVASGVAYGGLDWGLKQSEEKSGNSKDLFGIDKPLAASSIVSADPAAVALDPTKLVTLAKGLKAKVVTAGVAGSTVDQIALWPSDSKPTHMIFCNEIDGTKTGAEASMQRLDLKTGAVSDIAFGLTSCDPVRRTAWGTILFGEEAGATGRLYEMADPLNTNGVHIDRVTGATDNANVVARTAVGQASLEGIALYDSGLMYYADELRPSATAKGGAYYKFIPTTPWDGTTQITLAAGLSSSPLASGSVFGLRLGRRGDNGQGTETGLGTWIPLPITTSLAAAGNAAGGLSGFYRPEDSDIDLVAKKAGNVRFCANNTGNELQKNSSGVVTSGHTWGNTICVTDGTIAAASSTSTLSIPEVQLLVVGSEDMAMMDNIAYQPGFGNWIIHEDGDIGSTKKNNDLFSCLDDGADPDGTSDGCVRIATINDLIANNGEGAEWTGGIFDATGKHFYVSVQHNMTGKGVILDITGFER